MMDYFDDDLTIGCRIAFFPYSSLFSSLLAAILYSFDQLSPKNDIVITNNNDNN